MACNTCRCGPNNTLVCTKIACLENKILEEIEYIKSIAKRRQNVKSKNKNESKKINESKKGKNAQNALKDFPNLPKGDCVIGKIYRKGCRKCFCNENKVPICTKTCSENSSCE